MKTMIAAATAGLLLIAGQAAATQTVAPRVADRIGAPAAESSELLDIPLPVLIIGALVITGLVVAASDDDSESD